MIVEEKVERDFLVELAKAVDTLEKVNVVTKGITVTYDVTALEYQSICADLIRRKYIVEKPENELRLNLSGVMVVFKVQ